ncbi:MAG: RMD1 family protein [Bacteroidetes bacterium]|nr:RMD1 family protein [Bacteroidota bacterium]
MQTGLRLSAIRVANQLDLKGIKATIQLKPLADTSSELFYCITDEKYCFYFNYGVIVFAGYTEEDISSLIQSMKAFLKSPDSWLKDDLVIKVVEGAQMNFGFNELTVDRVNPSLVRIAMFNLAQSVSLDHYQKLSETLLTEIRKFTNDLEANGKLSINRRNMLKFIGKALNTQNDIAENLYIFDEPDLVWDDEYLDLLHKGLSKHFDLRLRFTDVEYTLRIIENNLDVFREISHQRESSLLEWIIITLILVEVLNLIVSKIF